MFFFAVVSLSGEEGGRCAGHGQVRMTSQMEESHLRLGYSSPQAQVPPQPHPKERALPDATLVESFVEFDRTTSRFGH